MKESIERNKIVSQRPLIWFPGKEKPLCGIDVCSLNLKLESQELGELKVTSRNFSHGMELQEQRRSLGTIWSLEVSPSYFSNLC